MYAFTCFTFVVASSIINATAILSLPLINKELHSIIVICTIHPDSEADGCKVIAVGGNVNRTRKYNVQYVHIYVIRNHVYMYLHTFVPTYVCTYVRIYIDNNRQ